VQKLRRFCFGAVQSGGQLVRGIVNWPPGIVELDLVLYLFGKRFIARVQSLLQAFSRQLTCNTELSQFGLGCGENAQDLRIILTE